MSFNSLVLALDLKEFVMTVFMIIGAVVSVVVTVIALTYGICFIVKLLVKTFSARVSSSIELMSDSIHEKKLEKKERKRQEREAKFEQKRELHKLKLESIARIGEMKRKKYRNKLGKKEDKTYEKMFGEPNPNSVVNAAEEEPVNNSTEELAYSETQAMEPEVKEIEPVVSTAFDEGDETEAGLETTQETIEVTEPIVETAEENYVDHEQVVNDVVSQSFADDGAPVLRGDKIPGGEFDEHSEDVEEEPKKAEDKEKFDSEIDAFKKELLHGNESDSVSKNEENESLWADDGENETNVENESIHTDETFEKTLSKRGRKKKKS